MAKYPIFCVRDSKSGFEPGLLIDQNDATALRGFGYQINNPNGIRSYSPGDYDLFKIGFFDTDSGQIEPMLPEFISNGVNVLNEK